MFRIVQANTGRSRAGMIELLSDCVACGVDVLLLQEPYSSRGTVPVEGMGRVFCVGLPRQNRGIDVWVCVVVLNDCLGAVLLSEFSSPYCVAVDLVTGGGCRVVVCSVYLRPGRVHDDEWGMVERVSVEYERVPLLIGCDVNCSSELWYGTGRGCARSQRIEDWVALQFMSVLNEWDERCTFETVNGRSNVDVSFCNDACLVMNVSWRLGDLCVDHRSIHMSVGLEDDRRADPERVRFVLSGANWLTFDRELVGRMNGIDGGGVDRLADSLTAAVLGAARASIPVRHGGKRVPWWGRQLADLRKSVKRARRRFQHARGERRLRLQVAWRNLRRMYVYTVSVCKWNAWRQWVSREGARNPWGIVYKSVIRGGVRNRVLVTVRREGRVTAGVNETLNAFLCELLPGDDARVDAGAQPVVRAGFVSEDGCGPCVGEWSPEALAIAVSKMKCGTAPGLDEISPDLVWRAWGRVKDVCLDLFNRCLNQGVYPAAWRIGEVVLIPKAGDRDLSLVKSFRPVTLLSVWGKLLERLIETSLRSAIGAAGGMSRKQYGFVGGKSTVDAVRHVIEWVGGCGYRFVLAVFLGCR
ncbi:uncharacterized protein LOC111057445 [Nilaparvata lugens]|uniref:uncharacterized protein LOC111057445 n=1 Tax=Nilaparvata lugens TaxID=108931 RepID=UPI00193DDD77|nr:uncharacterized protein LOC111057445 [Nilaparvata lugens]